MRECLNSLKTILRHRSRSEIRDFNPAPDIRLISGRKGAERVWMKLRIFASLLCLACITASCKHEAPKDKPESDKAKALKEDE
jgi:hypothetical protein